MAGEAGQQSADLIAQLHDEPAAFEFFQAVRLLLRERNANPDQFPNDIRIRPDIGLDYPETDVVELTTADDGGVELVATFLGLYGVSSPLPASYSEELLDDDWEEERSVRGFLDIVHNHVYPLLYRAWLKHRLLDNTVELAREDYWDLLFGLAGLREQEIRENFPQPERLLRYLGVLMQMPRSAVGLQTIIADELGPVPVRLEPCVVRWVEVPIAQRLQLGHNSSLGENSLIGRRVEDRGGRIRIHVGPLAGGDFQELINDAERIDFLRRLTNFYLVQPLQVELVFHITGESVLPARLGGESWACLGRDAWLRSGEESPPVTVRMMLQ